jgi:hypothetical protein
LKKKSKPKSPLVWSVAMTILKLILKVTSWICFLVGLVWTNKVSLESEDVSPPRVAIPEIISLSALEPHVLEVENPGELKAYISLGSMTESMLMRADTWLAEFKKDFGSTRRLHLAFTAKERKGPTWDIEVAKFAFRPGDTLLKKDNSFLHLFQGRFKFDQAGSYDLRAEFRGQGIPGNEIFEEAEFFLILGAQNEDIQNFVRLDPKPGLLLLGGTFGVFIHFFIVLIHLIVPWREPLPEVETEF